MSNVTNFPGGTRNDLTSAHRVLIIHIQDLAMDVSISTACTVDVDYSGHMHTLYVAVIPSCHGWQGDKSFRESWRREVCLPPSQRAAPNAIEQLTAVVNYLESLLPTRGGAA